MIFGAHVILYSKDATADRAFLRDILGFASVDAGHGWLIFALPPAEVAVHPAEDDDRHELYLMCDDLRAEMSTLKDKGVTMIVAIEFGPGMSTLSDQFNIEKVEVPRGTPVAEALKHILSDRVNHGGERIER